MKLFNIAKKFEKKIPKNNNTALYAGNQVRVGFLIQEADKKRIQFFEGIIISKKISYSNSRIKVRRVLQGIGVEKTFSINSPQIKSIMLLNSSRIKRSKLFYLRNRVGKAAFPTQKRPFSKFIPKLK